ncbi:hypothetical protein [Halorussus sp. MSC15.2]|uniref:hypothetical protein n=1 Tax=Halorussus sp. MSC15.2 TaxID=2283638 RepID=UPI0013D8322C|nr:hypothetical protein [Halorussus sp. MSC15.2]NEU56906.1 hypothetical protein [Halorussus sp. MSC15.2]
MPSTHSRRTLLRSCGLALGTGTAGCLGGFQNGDPSSDPDAPGDDATRKNESTARSTTASNGSTANDTATPRTTAEATLSPDVVSDEAAKERALAAEEAFLTERLGNASCLDNWGTYPTTAHKRATVVERTADGVRVEVSHPFSYSTRRTEADGASRAVYLVTADDARRVSGDTISPC